ncbi:hypothetical protein GCM10027515_30760 [Schumannella luteola]|uniref:Uncharacterized protein n=1 Tax=Schumannella luteola TaxID=472059 RepID=A0A852YBA6_9MICO|nr:hypothetical protein [Schumannella luteola]NYG99122.1 hypothetical protein [Schumannella luteola]TPX02322.1 hypothetical protein FJ656_22860 [Schumannella luteola]
MSRVLVSAVPVWVVALGAGLAVALVSGAAWLTWIPVVAALSLLVAFAIQLAVGRREGLVTRLGVSVVGVLIVLVAISGALAIVHPVSLTFSV